MQVPLQAHLLTAAPATPCPPASQEKPALFLRTPKEGGNGTTPRWLCWVPAIAAVEQGSSSRAYLLNIYYRVVIVFICVSFYYFYFYLDYYNFNKNK